MKTARRVLSIIAASLAAAALVIGIIVFWDYIAGFFRRIRDAVASKAASFCRPAEYDDFADLD